MDGRAGRVRGGGDSLDYDIPSLPFQEVCGMGGRTTLAFRGGEAPVGTGKPGKGTVCTLFTRSKVGLCGAECEKGPGTSELSSGTVFVFKRGVDGISRSDPSVSAKKITSFSRNEQAVVLQTAGKGTPERTLIC
jgi:hypothetical protein